jgi:transposase
MSSISNIYKQNKIGPDRKVRAISRADNIIAKQVFTGRRNEIHEYLKLFGYKADKTIIQVHITGFFRRK